MTIDIPEITDTSSYQYAFKKLKWHKTSIPKEALPRIFLAPLRIFDQPEETPETLTVPLHAGAGNDRYRLIVNLTNSTRGEANALRTDLRHARDEAEDNFRAGHAEPTWAFFIGTQDRDNLPTFHITDTTRICFITGEITYPTQTDTRHRRP